MHELSLSDQLFQRATRAAQARGFKSVEDYIEEVVREDLDSLVTPAGVLAKIDAGIADLDAGRKKSLAEVEADIAQRRSDWLDSRK